MSIWSGETLRAKLPELVSPFRSERVDCSSYTLSIGDEIYVSPQSVEDRKSAVIRKLAEGEDCIIPPGQFAFLITEEVVKVPRDAMAFISIKARIKWRGLVNVSGFHVDPGYDGKLIFAVFNAGPSTIHVKCGEPCFLMWYISLDRETNEAKGTPGYRTIPTDLVTAVSGDWKSLYHFEERIEQRMSSVEKAQAVITGALAFLVALAIAIFVAWMKPEIDAYISRTYASPAQTPNATRSAVPKRAQTAKRYGALTP